MFSSGKSFIPDGNQDVAGACWYLRIQFLHQAFIDILWPFS